MISRKDIDASKIATVIGSTKFEKEMQDTAAYLQSQKIVPIVTAIGKSSNYNIEENILMIEGYKRIDISDFVVCVNRNGYIGDNTAKEYYYAIFIARINVYFKYDIVSENMLRYLNFYWEDTNSNLHLWNYKSLFINPIKCIYIRNKCKFSNDIISINQYDLDLGTILEFNLRCQFEVLNINIYLLDDEAFEEKVRNSNLYID